ncbi:hypothetical protein ERUR111494_05120 [Erysipelothrix urinaevulpis]|uniref:hypothetical protein n=1 Tax=Erysipelothrix urinaevulpis TaxID=2683717 RepID=UPI0013572830|nr:hypothetical protein [Erysipelothrix urinaevulpis]
MLGLFKADFYRITHKRSFYYYTLFCTAMFTIIAIMAGGRAMSDGAFADFGIMMITLSPMIIGIFIYTLYFGDDIRYKNAQATLGYGYTRTSLLLYKFIFFVLLTISASAYLFLIIFVNSFIFGKVLPSQVTNSMVLISIMASLKTIIFATLSNIILYKTQQTSASTVVFVMLATSTLNMLLGLLLGQNFIINVIGNLTPYLATTLSNTVMNEWMANGIGYSSNLLILLGYILISLTAAVFLFEKKELEF